MKTALTGQPPAYSGEELATLARHCTDQEDNAEKVERQVRKSAAAAFGLLQAGIAAELEEATPAIAHSRTTYG